MRSGSPAPQPTNPFAARPAAYVIQFPHPGQEHRPRGPVMPWNFGEAHKRKFMVMPGTYRDEGSTEHHGEIVFWGEWEAPSQVVRQWPQKGNLPEFLHRPFVEHRPDWLRQNTDPFVFGDAFYYSNCKQRTNKQRTVTAMQHLTPGSLILFGSTVVGEFVLDTAFVVGKRLATLVKGEALDIELDDVFRVVTVESLILEEPEQEEARGRSFTLYKGATPSEHVHGMFSFVPCLPYDGDGPRFERPVIRLPGVINPSSWQAPRGSTQPRPVEDVVRSWESVLSQVLDQDLFVATRIDLPGFTPKPRRE